MENSPAIAVTKGTFVCSGTDQRGVNRPKDGDDDTTADCDIGAYEVGSNLVDLAIVQTASVSTAAVGDTVSFTFDVDNDGGAERAADVLVFDALPAGFSLTSATPSQGRCAEFTPGNVFCFLGSLEGGENGSASVTLVTKAVTAGMYENTAYALGSNKVDMDADQLDNSDAAVVTVTGGATPGTVQLSAASYTVGEAGQGVSVTVTRTGGSSGAASVNISDNDKESNETVVLTMGTPTNATLGTQTRHADDRG